MPARYVRLKHKKANRDASLFSLKTCSSRSYGGWLLEGRSRINVSSSGTAEDYALQAILEFNKGFKQVELYADSDDACKLIDAYLIMKQRMGEALRLASADVGSSRPRGRNQGYMSIILERLA
jgi:DNA-binding protein